jgi:hypothetical protein
MNLWDIASGEQRRTVSIPRCVVSVAMSLDGRWIAIAAAELFKEVFPTRVRISIYDVAANRIVATLPGHQTHINALSFSPDNCLLASAGSDTTALLWDVAALGRPGRRVPLTANELAACWAGLASTPQEAFDSMWKLVPDEQVVSFLQEKLPPVAAPPPEKEVRALVAGLGSDQFVVRSQAALQLAKFGTSIEAELRNVLEDKLTLETRRRVEELLRSIATQQLRTGRAIEVLETMNTRTARDLLGALAKGRTGALQTREAQASLERLTRRLAP